MAFDNLAAYTTRPYPAANLGAGPTQMTAHTLEAPKGWPSPHAVDFKAPLSSSVTIPVVYAGRCVHVEFDPVYNTLCFALGVRGGVTTALATQTATGAAGQAGQCDMAGFVFQNSNDPDVSNPGSGTVAGGWIPVTPSGNLNALMAAGAYELETTEYVGSGTNAANGGTGAAAYNPGDGLTAVTDNTHANGGVLCHGQAYKNALVGVVARGESINSHNQWCLSFWPVWLPQNAAAA